MAFERTKRKIKKVAQKVVSTAKKAFTPKPSTRPSTPAVSTRTKQPVSTLRPVDQARFGTQPEKKEPSTLKKVGSVIAGRVKRDIGIADPGTIQLMGTSPGGIASKLVRGATGIGVSVSKGASTSGAVVPGAVTTQKALKLSKPLIKPVTDRQALTSLGGGIENILKTGSKAVPVAPNAVNPKSTVLMKVILATTFSTSALALTGWWLGTTFFGMWGQAESPESLTFPISKFVVQNAQQTNNWTLFDESIAAAEDATDLTKWEQLLLNTPLAPFVGVTNKIKTTKLGIEVLKKVGEDLKTGESEDDRWKRIREEESAEYRANTDYRIVQNKIASDNIIVAQRAERHAKQDEEKRILRETGDFWAAQRERQFKQEAEERVRIAKFWLEYHKAAAAINNGEAYVYDSKRDTTPSKLGFGLL